MRLDKMLNKNKDLKEIVKYLCDDNKQIQLIIVMEELAELIQAVSKIQRKPDLQKNKDNLVEEIGDVLISIEHLKYIYSISKNDIKAVVDTKIKKIKDRI